MNVFRLVLDLLFHTVSSTRVAMVGGMETRAFESYLVIGPVAAGYPNSGAGPKHVFRGVRRGAQSAAPMSSWTDAAQSDPVIGV